MCGLVGAAGTLTYNHKKVMLDLLFLDSLRGRDSTGLAAVKRNREIMIRKQTVPGYEFIEIPTVYRMMENNDMVWMGHNRFKTQGEITRANAHPFEVLDEDGDVLLVGAHNGTLNNKYEIERKIGEKFDTDSEGLFHLLTTAPNFKEGINELRGAWSLTFWDATTNTLHFCRNKERPLVYAFTKDRKVVFWASEGWMLYNAAKRNNVELAENDKGMSVYATLPESLYSLEIPEEKDKELGAFVREGGYSGAQGAWFQPKRDWGTNWWDDDEDEDDNIRYLPSAKDKEKQEESEKRKEEARKAEEEDEKKIITLGTPNDPLFSKRGFKGEALTEKQLKEIVDGGCAWCGDKFKDGQKFAFIEEKAVICHHCMYDGHPKSVDGGRVRRSSKDNPPQEGSVEHERLIAAAAVSAKKTVG